MSTTKFDEVVFLDDFFRSEDNNLPAQGANRRFLRAFFQDQFARAGLRIREEFAKTDGGKIPVEDFMQELGLERGVSGWAAAGIADLSKAFEKIYPLDIGTRSLVVAWGLPASIQRHIDDCGASYIDIEIDPLRFSQHLHLCVRTNAPHIESILQELEVTHEAFLHQASVIKAYFARRGSDALFHPSVEVGLFAGQTEVDLALVSDGRLASPTDFRSELRSWADEVDLLLVKAHPYAAGSDHLAEALQGIPNVQLVEHNIYGMLCASNLKFVGALSSGVLQEARFFGIESRRLVAPDRTSPRRLPKACSRWFAVRAEFGGSAVVRRLVTERAPWWRRIGATAADRPTFSPDTLELIFGIRWGLDTQSHGLPDCFPLERDRRVFFGAEQATTAWLQTGWQAPEPWGVWSDGSIARLALPLAPGGFGGLGTIKLALRGMLLQRGSHVAAVTAVEIDGNVLQPVVSQLDRLAVIEVEIDGRHWEGRSLTLMTIHISGAAKPAEIDGGTDFREIGFGLESLIVEAAESGQLHKEIIFATVPDEGPAEA